MRKSKAFLLLEVMLAMVMVTSGLLFVIRIYSAAKGAMDRSRALFASSLLLEQKMFDLQASAVLHGTGRTLFPDHKGCYWEARVTPIAEEPLRFFKVTLGVSLPPSKTCPDTYWLETYLVKTNPEKSR